MPFPRGVRRDGPGRIASLARGESTCNDDASKCRMVVVDRRRNASTRPIVVESGARLLSSILLFVVGAALLIYSAEKLISYLVGAASGLRVPVFLLAIIFTGKSPLHRPAAALARVRAARRLRRLLGRQLRRVR